VSILKLSFSLLLGLLSLSGIPTKIVCALLISSTPYQLSLRKFWGDLVGLKDVFIFIQWSAVFDRLCGLVIRVPGCRSRGPGSIPGATRISEK
jgi:hypothetical protein